TWWLTGRQRGTRLHEGITFRFRLRLVLYLLVAFAAGVVLSGLFFSRQGSGRPVLSIERGFWSGGVSEIHSGALVNRESTALDAGYCIS
ncbi:MAG: hypothetical protein LBG22_03425, partial [Treponema sp.]|nr:hypothetical protein [Treponema sp.]